METNEQNGKFYVEIEEVRCDMVKLLHDSQQLIKSSNELKQIFNESQEASAQQFVPVIFSEDEDEDEPTLTEEEIDVLVLNIKDLPETAFEVIKLMLQQLEGNLEIFEPHEMLFDLRHLKPSTLRILKNYVESKLHKPEQAEPESPGSTAPKKPKRLARTKDQRTK